MASNFDAILANTNPQALAAHSSYTPFGSSAPVSAHPLVQKLNNQLKSGQINHQQYLTKFASLTNSPLKTPRYSVGNTLAAAKNASVSVAKNAIINPTVNTAKLPANALSLAVAEATHNQKFIKSSTGALTNSALGSFISPLAQTAVMGGTNLAARKILNSNQSPEVKQAQLTQAVNPSYNKTGFDLKDTSGKTKLKEAILAASDIAAPLLTKGAGNAIKGSKVLTNSAKQTISGVASRDLLERAKEPSPAPSEKPNVAQSKVSGSSLRTQAEAVQAGMKADEQAGATYSTLSHKVEADKAVKLLRDNPEKAKAIAMGERGDNASHEAAVYHAVKNQALENAKKSGDYSEVLSLANSSRHTGVSEAAQKLGAEGFNTNAHDPVSVINDVAKTRASARNITSDKLTKAVNTTKNEINQTVTTPSRQDWHSFVDSLKC